MKNLAIFTIVLVLLINVLTIQTKRLEDGAFHGLIGRFKRQAPLGEEITFFDTNVETNVGEGRSIVKHPLRSVLDGAPESPEIVRLRSDGLTNATEGRVEIYDKSSKRWGLICDDYWNLPDANVTCRQLGFRSGACYQVNVNPLEYNLYTKFPITFPPFEIRLTGSGNKWEGNVEVRYQGEWGFVCDDGFDMNAANVVCKQLGFLGAMEAIHNAVNRFGKKRSPNLLLDEVKCTGSELSIEECRHSPWRSHNCRPDELAGVVCKIDRACLNTEFRCQKDRTCIGINQVCDKSKDCSDGADEPEGKCIVEASLINGPDSKSGIVVLSRADTKGTVCDDGYDDNDAKVLCRMLGIPGRAEAVKDKRFGEGTGSIVLENLRCNGDEDNVEKCNGFKWGSHKCTHKEDIGILCGLPDMAPRTTNKVEQDANLKCGKRPIPHKRGSVVGGFEPMYGNFPWQVGVRNKTDDEDSHMCGGTILSEDWIISAAHCFERPKNKYRVRTGDYDNSATNNDKYEQVFEIEELILHPQWDNSSFDYDLALIKIERNNGEGINFNNYVQPVCLPKLGMVPDPNTQCLVSGWGVTFSHDPNKSYPAKYFPKKLLAAEVPLILHERCVESYKERITDRMQCAGYNDGCVDTCQGDSGGPLVCQVNGVFTVFGATSWGDGCGKKRKPGVYAKIQDMLGWVKNITGL